MRIQYLDRYLEKLRQYDKLNVVGFGRRCRGAFYAALNFSVSYETKLINTINFIFIVLYVRIKQILEYITNLIV